MSKQLPVESIQIKRIVLDVERPEGFTTKLEESKPQEGEIVQVITPGEGSILGIKTPFIIIGDNTERSLYQYIEDGDVYITYGNIAQVYSGDQIPSPNIGKSGDIYIQYEEVIN
jgi:hypothetical protein